MSRSLPNLPSFPKNKYHSTLSAELKQIHRKAQPMIYTIKGTITEVDVTASMVVIECGGIGYKLTVTANTLSSLPSPSFTPSGEADPNAPHVRVYTYMSVKEDAVELFGFSSKEELDTFKLLISVSGVGPKGAISILSLLPPKKLALTVAAEDSKAISRAPGIGAKTAARVILELKDKLAKAFPLSDSVSESDPVKDVRSADGGKLSDAYSALTVLGYSRSEIAAAMKNVDMTGSLEDMIKSALASLMKQ